MKKRYQTAILSLILLLSLLSCTKTEIPIEESETPTVLTHVYKEQPVEIPEKEGYTIHDFVGVDGENLLFLGSYYHGEVNPETGETIHESYPFTCAIPTNGGEPVYEKLDWTDYPRNLCLFDDGMMALNSTRNGTAMAESYTITLRFHDGTTKTAEKVERFFSSADEYFYLQDCCVDKEGYIYLFSDSEAVVLKPDFSVAFILTMGNWVESVEQDAAGTVYVSYADFHEATGDYKQFFVPICKDTKQLGETITLPDNITAEKIFFGDGYDLFYYNKTGIYGYNRDDTAGTLLMHFQNSDITGGNIDMVKVLDEDTFLLEYYDNDQNHKTGMFTKAPDIDLSQIQVIEIATAEQDYYLPLWVVEYNRFHDTSRIVVTDYSQYATEEDPNGAQNRLANDILNGIITPDILYGKYNTPSYQAVLQNDLYVDLHPYLTTDTVMPEEDLFGCITNTFQKDGKLFGLPTGISIETIIANKNLVGDRDFWTVEEMIDCIANLPEGVTYMPGVTRKSAASRLLGNSGYDSFVNMTEGTCTFDSPAFVSLLTYMGSLPEEDSSQNRSRYELCKTGKAVAASVSYDNISSFFSSRVYFGLENTVHIGYPTSDGYSGVRLRTSSKPLYTILTTAEAPADCWAFIRDAVIAANATDEIQGGHALPMLRSALESMKKPFKNTTFLIKYDGGTSWSTGGNGLVLSENDLKTGEAFRMTDADWNYIETFLDTIGGPIGSSTLPEDLSVIIEEEISAFLSGAHSATGCAAMLQNRVSLYLTERR